MSNAFQYSGTKIITPAKIYDPNNEFDEEYFEFGLFMSRREYKTINRRLHSGIIASASEGKHVGASAPYGYDKYKLPKQKGFSLKINESESKIIKFIFSSYINGTGIQTICNKLSNMGLVPKRSKDWGKSTITHILTNPVYIGKIKYSDKATKKKNVNGRIVRVKNNTPNVIFVDGLHEPIIDISTWNKVQEIRKNNLTSRTKVDYTLKNPMSSILKCGICGKAMSRITYSDRNDVRICCRFCKENVGSNIDYVEGKLLQSLELLLNEYKLKLINKDNTDIDLMLNLNCETKNNLQIELNKTQLQLNNLYDLLEQGIYNKETFIERLNVLKSKIDDLEGQIIKIDEDCEKISKSKNNKEVLIPKIENVINTYSSTDDIILKNKLLKSVLKKVNYTKINPKDKDDFKLVLFPKLY